MKRNIDIPACEIPDKLREYALEIAATLKGTSTFDEIRNKETLRLRVIVDREIKKPDGYEDLLGDIAEQFNTGR